MAFLPTNASQVQQFAVALYGIKVGSATMSAVQADITAVGGLNKALNAYYAASFGSSTTASVAASVAANLGLTGTAATDAAAYITAVLNGTAASARGEAIMGVLSLFSTLTSNATFGAAATAWNTKVAAAVAYTGASDAAVVAGSVTEGTAFVLTTGVDAFTGSDANDSFNADNTGATVTLSSADVLNGGAGTDTLNVFSVGTAFSLPKLTSVETVNVYDQNADQSTASSNFASVTTVNLIRGDGDVALTVGSAVSTVGLTDVKLKDAGANNAVTINADADATAIAVTLDNVTIDATADDEQITIAGAKLTTVTINTTGLKSAAESINAAAATTVNVNAAVDLTSPIATTGADSTLNISGAGKVTITATDANFDVVNASSNTGGVVLTTSSNVDAVITLGSGKDTVTTNVDGFATADKFAVNAGEGEDTLSIAADADVDSTAEAGRYTGFEVIKRAINANLDVSTFGSATTIVKASLGDGGLTKMQAALAGAITVTADNAGSTFSLATATGTADVLSVTTAHATATTSADLTTVTIDGFETLNVAVNSGDKDLATAADLTAVSFTSAANLKTITVTGSKAISLDASANAVKVTAIDASGITGGANISTGAQTGALTVNGSAAKDVITLAAVGAGGSIALVDAGAADDKIATTMAIAGAATSIIGGAGSDTLSFSDTATTTNSVTVSDNTFRNINVEVIDFSAAIAGDLSWTLGGYANALAAANAGVLKITAKALATAAAADDITIDASAMGTGNSVNLDIKNTGADFASDVALTGSDGNDTIKFEDGTAASDVITTITSGKGNDTVTIKTTATHDGAIVVDAGDGDDTIDISAATADAAVTANLITGGKGNDTITLDTEGAATAVTIVTAATAANNGVDTIVNFTQGAASDVLKIDAFLNATAMNAVLTANPAAVDVENDVNLLVDIAGGQDITTAAGLTAALAAGGEYSGVNMAGSAVAVFVTAASSAASVDQNVFFAETDAGGNISVTLVGVIKAGDIDSFDAANFNI